MIDCDDAIEIRTSCGGTFHMRPSEMSEWQLRGLIEQNPEHEAVLELRAELASRGVTERPDPCDGESGYRGPFIVDAWVAEIGEVSRRYAF
jgi:hypothetical protein